MKKIVSTFLCVICVILGAIGFSYAQNGGVAPSVSQNTSGSPSLPSGGGGSKPPCDPEVDIMLNLDIPFIGRCIKKKIEVVEGKATYSTVFPKLVAGMSRIVMTAIIIIGFVGILAGGFMIAGNGAFGTKEKGKKLIVSILAGFILLGASGIILNLINPAFFGTAS